MSLRVWLPLNGDLHNQGLSNISLSGSPTWGTGKIGGKSFCCNTGITGITINDLVNVTEFSIAYWLYIDSSITDFTNYADFWGLQAVSGNTTTIIRDELRTNTANLGRHALHMIKDASVGSNTNTYYGLGERDDAKDKWCHVVITKDENYCDAYANGVRYAHAACSNFENSPAKLNGKFWLGMGGCKSAYLNDFRLYDHCLSPMEVKELAKGLVLHYPLNRGGFGNENIIAGTKPTEQTYTYPSSNYQDKFAPITTVIPSGDKYTLSFYAKSTVAGDKIRAHYYSPNTTTTCVSSQGITKTASDGNMDFTLSTEWKLYWVTYTQTETTAVKHVILPRMGAVGNTSGIVSGTGTVSIKCLKLEAGDKPTPWCPNSSDALATTMGLNSTTEYDCSGFCNNGTRTGTFEWTSDTPKYGVSTFFEQGVDSYIVTPAITFDGKGFTGSYWFKSSSVGKSDYQMPLSTGGNYEMSISPDGKLRGGIYINGTRYVYNAGDSNYLDGKWHMFTMTYNGTIICRYVDGVLKHSETISGTSNIASNVFAIGRHGASNTTYGSINLYESDVRIYATALSASDVKSLYQNSAYIDSSGNVYGAVYSEV